MNVCTTFHDKPSNSCWDIAFKTTNGNLMLALKELVAIHHVQTMNVWTTCVDSHVFYKREMNNVVDKQDAFISLTTV